MKTIDMCKPYLTRWDYMTLVLVTVQTPLEGKTCAHSVHSISMWNTRWSKRQFVYSHKYVGGCVYNAACDMVGD